MMIAPPDMVMALRMQDHWGRAWYKLEILKMLQAAGVKPDDWLRMLNEIVPAVLGPEPKPSATVTPLKAVDGDGGSAGIAGDPGSRGADGTERSGTPEGA